MKTAVRIAVLGFVVLGVAAVSWYAATTYQNAQNLDKGTRWDNEAARPEVQRQLQEVPKMERVPMIVKYREAALDNSYVLMIRNDSGKLMRSVLIKVANTATGKNHEWKIDQFPNGELAELGWQEGWKFFPGDDITITAENYAPLVTKLAP